MQILSCTRAASHLKPLLVCHPALAMKTRAGIVGRIRFTWLKTHQLVFWICSVSREKHRTFTNLKISFWPQSHLVPLFYFTLLKTWWGMWRWSDLYCNRQHFSRTHVKWKWNDIWWCFLLVWLSFLAFSGVIQFKIATIILDFGRQPHFSTTHRHKT